MVANAPELRFADAGDERLAPLSFDEPDVHIWRTSEGAVVAYGYQRGGFCWMHWPRLATYRFASSDAFVTAFPQEGRRSDAIRDTYRRSVLPMVLQALGLEAMHASAIAVEAGVVAFAARSKTGKSTVAFGLSCRGFSQWADDSVVFRGAGDAHEAVPLAFNVRLRPESSTLLGSERRSGPRRVEGARRPPAGPAPIAGICLLERLREQSDRSIVIRHLPPEEAFPAVLTHAHVFNPFDVERRKRMMETYLGLVAGVPVYEVRFEANPSQFSELLDAIGNVVTTGFVDRVREVSMAL